MIYSKEGDRLVFVVDKGSFPENSICDVVNGVYSSIKTRQVNYWQFAKQEFKLQRLIQELVEPTCEIKQDYLEEDPMHDDTYYLEMAALEFQGTDFLVPTNQLVQKTDDISAIFGSTSAMNETPIQFFEVTANDFRGLMKYLYPLDVNYSDELIIEDWVAILRLSTKWRMPTLREEAIQKLKNNDDKLSAVMKVQLGKEYMITEWVRSGLVALVEREEHFTEADVVAIGLETVSKLCELREQRYAGEWDTYRNRLTLEAHGTSNLIVDRISRINVMDHLDYNDDDLVTAVLDAQSLGNQRLMLDAWGRMARRFESLTFDEVERLTLGTALMMWEVRLETRRAAWSLVQEYGAKCDAKALDSLQRIASAFTSELKDIEVQALNYALASFKPSFNKGKKPAFNAYGDGEKEEEEIPDSALEPMPSSESLFSESLALRRKIINLEQQLHESVETTSGRQLQKELRRCRLSAQKWHSLVFGSSAYSSTLILKKAKLSHQLELVNKRMINLILQNVGKLSLSGGYPKSTILAWAAQHHIETQTVEDSRLIDFILPVSES